MNGPSRNALPNTVAIFSYDALSQDADGGASGGDTPLAAAARCRVNPGEPRQDTDAQGRVTVYNTYTIVFGSDTYALKIRDRIVWVDEDQTSHTLYVVGIRQYAGRGGVRGVMCEERA